MLCSRYLNDKVRYGGTEVRQPAVCEYHKSSDFSARMRCDMCEEDISKRNEKFIYQAQR